MKARKSHKLPLNRLAIQLPLLFFAAGFAVILLFCGVIYFAVSGVLLRETIDHTKGILNMSSMNISTYIDRLWSETSLFAGDPDLKSYLSAGDGNKEEKLRQRIALMLDNDPYIQSVVAVSKDGRILSNEQNLDMSVSEDMMQEKWYTDALHNSMPVLTGARMQSFSSDKNSWVISVSTEVTGENGENAGVLLVDMKYSVIEGLLQSLNLGTDGYVFLLNEENEPVYHKNTAYFKEKTKKEELIALRNQGTRYDKTDNLLSAATYVENAGWTMVAVVYLDNLLVLQRHLFQTVLLTGGLLLALMVVIGFVFTGRLTKPIRKLEKNMQQIEKLTEIAPDPGTFYEMELFAENYNRMIQRVRKLLEELSLKEENLRRMELQTLTDQINPHFLYNTLDTILWMAEFGDSARVIALTKSLAAFFRLSLSGGRSCILVREELEHVRQYLFIQKERYEEKVTYDITADEEALPFLVPKLILQPLAENCIYHGIKPMDRPGHISIRASCQGDALLLTVTDDGVGFVQKSGENAGVGLDNVRKRIALYYGDQGSVKVHSRPGEGCRVGISISGKLLQKSTDHFID